MFALNGKVLARRLIVVFVVSATGCDATDSQPASTLSAETVSDPQLALDLKLLSTGTAGERCESLERMTRYWECRPRVLAGFSDLPIESNGLEPKSVPKDDIEAIATALQTAISDPDHEVRKAAAICLCSAPEPSPAVNAAITVALQSADSSVLWNLMELDPKRVPLPEPGPCVPNLIRHLQTEELTPSFAASQLIRKFGERFVPHTDAVTNAFDQIPAESRWRVLLAMGQTGLSESAAERLPDRVRNDTPQVKAAAFVALHCFPDKASRFLRDHPDLGEELSEIDAHWYQVLCSKRPDYRELQEALLATPRLGPLNLALIGSPESIPELERELATADSHRQALLKACIRACGGDIGEVVYLSDKVPVAFKPRSAWPDTDGRRQSESPAHGDGIVNILVTGELTFPDGGHPAEVRFVRSNDAMLMGEAVDELLPARYDEATGRFVVRTTVFAAYSYGESAEPGPHQTGSAQVRIESADCKPLTVQFFDEMPHVAIELPLKQDLQ